MRISVLNFFQALVVVQCLLFFGTRFWGIRDTVTYVDELITISEGSAAVHPTPFVPASSPFRYAYHLMNNTASSYAPLQGFWVAFFNRNDVFTRNALICARLLAALATTLGVFFLFLALKEVFKDKLLFIISLSLLLTLLMSSEMLAINSQQATPYTLGFMTTCLAVYASIRFAQNPSSLINSILFLSLCLFPFANYQGLISGASFALATWIVQVTRAKKNNLQPRAKQMLYKTTAAVFLIGISYIPWVLWLQKSKSEMVTPWWLKNFIRPTGLSLIQLASSFFMTCKRAASSLLLIRQPGGILTFRGVAFFLCIVPGLIFRNSLFTSNLVRSLKTKLDNSVVLLIGLGTLLCFTSQFALWFRYTGSALAPSRHSLFLLPLVALVLVGLNYLVLKLTDHWFENFSKFLLITFFSLSVFHNIASFQTWLFLTNQKKESWDRDFLSKLNPDSYSRNIVVTWSDSSKLYLILKEQGLIGNIKLFPIMKFEEFPKGDFIFITQFLDPHIDLLPPAHKSPHQLIKSISTGFDFEPSPLIKYWPNDFYVWQVSEKGNL